MTNGPSLFENWAAAAAKLASAKEKTVCMTTGEHAIHPQTWKCLHCQTIVPVMKAPALVN